MTHHSVEATGLTKTYRTRSGTTRALDGLDLIVRRGTVHGILGPNGAGKTTAVRVLATLTTADAGTALVDGVDVGRDPDGVRSRIGLAGQHAAVDEKMTGRENLRMFGRLYHLGERGARGRAGHLLEQFGLTDAAERLVATYSGGMRRRLDLAASLIIAPSLLFLDEPTTGLDPRARREVWHSVRSLVDGGTTVLLTTQYLDEADQLADDIAVVDHGRVIASGSPHTLKAQVGGDQLELTLSDPGTTGQVEELLIGALGRPVNRSDDGLHVSVAAPDGAATLTTAIRVLDRHAISPADVLLRRPTLDDVFLTLTGQRAEKAEAA